MDAADERVFAEYVAARSPALLRTAYLLVGQRADAEDLLQASLAKTYLAWGRIREPAAADAYVRRVMVNTRTSWWRRRRVDEYPSDSLPETVADDATGASDLHDALWSALETLPRRQRAVLVLRYWCDLSEAQTADELGISPGTVKSTASRALASLRDRVRELGLTDDPRLDLPQGAHR